MLFIYIFYWLQISCNFTCGPLKKGAHFVQKVINKFSLGSV